MAEWQGFWSYVHSDDQADGGRIKRLASDVVAQYEMLTGESIGLFLDRDAINWGDVWRQKVDDTLTTVAFFVAVITPRYFMSSECRRELQFFARQATKLGVRELVLPLHYVEVPALRDEEPADDLIALVKPFHWEDWRDLRFADVDSEKYRRGVAGLAAQLVEANRRAESINLGPIEQSSEPEGDETPGFLDKVATAETTLPEWTGTLERIRQDIELIGQMMQQASEDMAKGSQQGKGFAARLTIARRVSKELPDPVERIWSSANEFATQLHQVDEGFRTIIERAPVEIQENPEAKMDLCTFFEMVRDLSRSAHDGLGAVETMINAISPVESMSRDLRPPLRRLKQGLTVMVEAREVTDEWVQLIDDSGVECQ